VAVSNLRSTLSGPRAGRKEALSGTWHKGRKTGGSNQNDNIMTQHQNTTRAATKYIGVV
jgi:hypothetical protein